MRPGVGAALLALALAAAPAGADSVRAQGGSRLIHALESAPATVVGLVKSPKQVDLHGWVATLAVQQSVVGPIEEGATVEFAWEKLSQESPVRFADGDRILVSLERLPHLSIWRKRFPDGERRVKILHVAQEGRAYLLRPTIGGVLILDHYARLGAEGRESPTGAGYLVQLVSGAQPQLALSAASRLEEFPALDEKLTKADGDALVATLLRPDASQDLHDAVLDLISRHRLEVARPALEAEARKEGRADPSVFSALGRLDGELSPERTTLLLEEGPVEHRVAAARYASGPDAEKQLRGALSGDPAPEVRAAAVERLVVLRREEALEPALRALDDEDNDVRNAAALALGTLGASAVPEVRRIVENSEAPAARAGILALVKSGSKEGAVALVEISQTHEDRGIRALAKIATGQPIGDTHD